MLFVFFLAFSLLPSLHGMICNQIVNGHMYDLTPLEALGDVSVTSVGDYNYYISVCGSVVNPACSSKLGGMVCQVRKSPPDQFEAILGYSDIQQHPPEPTWTPSTSEHGGVKLNFTNGDRCSNNRTRILVLDFQCDHSNSRNITVTDHGECAFTVVYPTNHTCLATPSSSSSSSSSSTGPSSSSSSSSSEHSDSSSSSSGHSDSSSSSSSTDHISSSSSTGPHSHSSSSSSSSSIDSSTGSTGSSSIPSDWSSSSTGEISSSTGEISSSGVSSSVGPNPTSIPSSSSSTGTNPTNAPSKDEGTTITITGAGIGLGVLIGTSATSALVLLWCCYDRNRRRGQNGSTSERQYAAMDA